MKLVRVLCGVCLLVFAFGVPASAHPAPFSYLDVRMAGGSLNITVVAHSFDLAHDLAIEPVQQLLDPAFVTSRSRSLASLLQSRFQLQADGRPVACEPSERIEILEERLSLKFRFSCSASGIGVVGLRSDVPLRSQPSTFVNVMKATICGRRRFSTSITRRSSFAGTRQASPPLSGSSWRQGYTTS
jgi:hypothetical protein